MLHFEKLSLILHRSPIYDSLVKKILEKKMFFFFFPIPINAFPTTFLIEFLMRVHRFFKEETFPLFKLPWRISPIYTKKFIIIICLLQNFLFLIQ